MSIMKKEKNKGLQVYGIYKGDKFIDVGTAQELSKRLNVKKETIWFWGTSAYRKRIEQKKYGNSLIAVAIGKDEDYGKI